MKLKHLLIKITFILSLFIVAAEAKPLPPGTGEGDVPANVLLLLDKSGSMGWCMPGGDHFCRPWDVTFDDEGNVFGIQYWRLGITKLDYATMKVDTTFADAGNYDLNEDDDPGCDVTNGGYQLLDYYDDHIYSGNYNLKYIVKINSKSGACVRKWDLSGRPHSMDLKNGHLFVNVENGGLESINLTNGNKKVCGNNNAFVSASNSITVDAAMENLYAHHRDTNTGLEKIYRFALSSDGTNFCNSSSSIASSFFGFQGGSIAIFGQILMDKNDSNKMYVVNWLQSTLSKVTLAADRSDIATWDWTIGSRGTSKSTTSNVLFWFPYGIAQSNAAFGQFGAGALIATAGLNKSYAQFFNQDGDFKNQTNTSKSRMDGAKLAIKSIVADTSLTTGINFGYGHWSYRWMWNGSSWVEAPAKISSWQGVIETGRGIPNNDSNAIDIAIDRSGAKRIQEDIDAQNAGGGTDATTFSELALSYYSLGNVVDANGKKVCPIDSNLTCASSYALIIGDGDFNDSTIEGGKNNITSLAAQDVITIMVGYGPGITASGKATFNEMAILGDPKKIASKGETPTAIFASTPRELKTELISILSSLTNKSFSFTAPAISATIEEGGSLYQATFKYKRTKEWEGDLTKVKIDSEGKIDETHADNWSVHDSLQQSSNRKIWTVLESRQGGADYKFDYNNFVAENKTDIQQLFNLSNNTVLDYHRDSAIGGSSKLARCGAIGEDKPLVVDGIEDDLEGLINFVRGQDWFDYDGDCDLTEERVRPFGDIYHSELVVVGKPNAETAYRTINQEAYWRSLNNYQEFADDNENREEIIYAGSNSGLLMAIQASDGKEKWSFVPPFVASRLPELINTSYNLAGGGGTNPIFGVDGSPTVHDMHFTHPILETKGWYTILMIPYGRGGAGFSVLDVTDPDAPLHLYSVFNNEIDNQMNYVDHKGEFTMWEYISSNYPLSKFAEAREAETKKLQGAGTDCKGTRDLNGELTSTCWLSKFWTFPEPNITKSDIDIFLNGNLYNDYSVSQVNGETKITFGTEMTYQASHLIGPPSSKIIVKIKDSSARKGIIDDFRDGPDYDYSELAETWSSPRIFRMPNFGSSGEDSLDIDITDDKYVAVMGAGMGNVNDDIGSSVFVIDLENGGKILKNIRIEDLVESDIINSTPATPTIITADTGTTGITYTGALVYMGDLEGKITKINLTNMICNNGQTEGNCQNEAEPIKIYDQTTLFKVGSSISDGKYMYHSLDATIGATTGSLWLYNSTGDYARINDTTLTTANIMFGIKDIHFPNFKIDATALDADSLSNCSRTTTDTTGENCPKTADKGWFINLRNFAKGTAEPTVYAGRVYFPIYQPTSGADKCVLGNAYICSVDDECGTNVSVDELNDDTDPAVNKNRCKYVGQGVLSKIIIYSNRLFANLAGNAQDIEDLVSIPTANVESESVRNSWRENY
jgi:type IV pilus assembly protein PilY1